jgi:hypothetical protein
MAEFLFGRGHLHELINQRMVQLKQELWSWSQDYLLNASESDILTYLADKYTIEPITLRVEDKTIADTRPITMRRPSMWGDGRMAEVQGQLIVIAMPFEGDRDILRYQPSQMLMRSVEADITANEIHLQYEAAEENAPHIGMQMSQDANAIAVNVEHANKDVAGHNTRLPDQVRAMVSERKRAFLQQLSFVESLNIPVRRREGVPQTYAVPSVKRKPRIEKPTVQAGAFLSVANIIDAKSADSDQLI